MVYCSLGLLNTSFPCCCFFLTDELLTNRLQTDLAFRKKKEKKQEMPRQRTFLRQKKWNYRTISYIYFSEPLCIITEFAPYGDLLGFLRKKRGLDDGYYDIEHLPRKSLTTNQLMQFAWEIADGMAHLSAAKVRTTICHPTYKQSIWAY